MSSNCRYDQINTEHSHRKLDAEDEHKLDFNFLMAMEE